MNYIFNVVTKAPFMREYIKITEEEKWRTILTGDFKIPKLKPTLEIYVVPPKFLLKRSQAFLFLSNLQIFVKFMFVNNYYSIYI